LEFHEVGFLSGFVDYEIGGGSGRRRNGCETEIAEACAAAMMASGSDSRVTTPSETAVEPVQAGGEMDCGKRWIFQALRQSVIRSPEKFGFPGQSTRAPKLALGTLLPSKFAAEKCVSCTPAMATRVPATVSFAGLRVGACGGLFAPRMHLRFSDQELVTLVEMVSLAANIAEWNEKETADQKVAAYEAFASKILEKAQHSGLADLIEFDEERQRFRIRPEAEEQMFHHECYDEFRNESFWDELALRLSDRDLIRSIGQKAWDALTEDQRRERTGAWEKRYWEEFSRHGVDRVHVIAPPGEG
jgi:hypothetical protein